MQKDEQLSLKYTIVAILSTAMTEIYPPSLQTFCHAHRHYQWWKALKCNKACQIRDQMLNVDAAALFVFALRMLEKPVGLALPPLRYMAWLPDPHRCSQGGLSRSEPDAHLHMVSGSRSISYKYSVVQTLNLTALVVSKLSR